MTDAHVWNAATARPTRRLDRLLRLATFPAGLVIAASAATAIHLQALPTMALQAGAMLATMALAALVERRLPFRAAWRQRKPGEARTDLTSLLVLMTAVDPLIKRLLLPLLASAALTIAQPFGGLGWFPTGWPLPAQLALAAVIAELGQYGAHRAGHQVRWMWAVHGFHHHPQRVDWLNGLRVNPLNMVWHQLAGLGVLVLLGAPEPVLQMLVVFATVVAILQHVNADLGFAPWNRLFSTADLHRWHHAAAAGQAQVNFGTMLVLWDQVFGTYHRHPQAPHEVGIAGHPPRASGYLAGMREVAALVLGPRPR
jgi:sterol desaturase/sphingolipid hydroxylase (fatty acid hydroxylase superfamily)